MKTNWSWADKDVADARERGERQGYRKGLEAGEALAKERIAELQHAGDALAEELRMAMEFVDIMRVIGSPVSADDYDWERNASWRLYSWQKLRGRE